MKNKTKDIRSCSLCNRMKDSITVNMSGNGVKNPDIVFIGEAPGEDEDTLGEPFVGRAGRYLRRQLFPSAGIDINSIYITNAVRCRPKSNATPKLAEIRNCRKNLITELKRIKPKVCVLLGNVPLTSCLMLDKVGGISKWRGKAMWWSEVGCYVIPTFHPSALMRDRSLGLLYRTNLAIEDLETAVQLVSRKPPVFTVPGVRVIKSIKELESLYTDIEVSGCVSLDLETSSLDVRGDILGCSMCFKSKGEYVPIYFDWSVVSGNLKKFNSVLNRVDVIFHNAGFDDKYLRFHGVTITSKKYDTFLATHLIDENFSDGLKENTWRYLNFGGYDCELEEYKFRNKFTKKSSYASIPKEILSKYAGLDALATYMLHEKFMVMLKEEKLLPLYEKISLPARSVFTDMECSGFKLNTDYAKKLNKKCEIAKDKLLKQVYKYVGHEFDINSNNELAKLLFEELDFEPVTKTKTGKPSVDKNTLNILSKQKKKGSKVLGGLLKYRYIEKLQGTFIKQALTHVWDDGKVRSSFNLNGTVTGRASNSKPCTHNIPKDRLVRSMYVPSNGVLIEADIKAAELRGIALDSGETVFLDAFKNGIDIHNTTFNTMFNKPKDYIPNQDERRLAKTINFGLIYGITPVGLAPKLKVSKEKAKELMILYFDKLPKIKSYLRRTVKFAHDNGYVISRFGRKRRLPEIFSDDLQAVAHAERQAKNSPIQSVAADYTYIGLIRVSSELKKRRLKSEIVQSVHDCIVVDCFESEVDEVIRIIRNAFKPIKAFPLEMEVDIEVVKCWGEKGESNLEIMLDEILKD